MKIRFTLFRIVILVSVPFLLLSSFIKKQHEEEAVETVKEEKETNGFFVAEERGGGDYNELQTRFKLKDSSNFFGFLAPESDTSKLEKKEEKVKKIDEQPLLEKKVIQTNNVKVAPVQKQKEEEVKIPVEVKKRRYRRPRVVQKTSQALKVKNIAISPDVNAEIWQRQKVVEGSRVPLLVTKAVVINGKNIVANSILYGFVSFDRDRVQLFVNIGNTRFCAYDATDGNKGLYAPDILDQQLVKEAKEELLTDTEGTTIKTPSLFSIPSITIRAAKKKLDEVSTILNAKKAIILKEIEDGK